MRIEGNIGANGEPAVQPVRAKGETPSARSAKAEAPKAAADPVDPKRAQQVAEALSNQFGDRDIRFYVRDPTSTEVHNLVIEVVDAEGKVVATIPPQSMNRLARIPELGADGADSKGVLVDQVG
ncbi:MAG: flagellar protein FlaG [Deltaproteobacteria bacterium]|nr:flagellar protein FlaG [Deltaproteobacteria bacterium]